MTRALYRFLLRIHPPAFRRQFAGEMLWIFDEAAKSGDILALFADGLISLFRQWVVRSGSWKVAAAVAGGLLEVTLGGLGMAWLSHAQRGQPASHVLNTVTMRSLMQLILWSAGGLVLMVVVVSLWFKSFTRSRVH